MLETLELSTFSFWSPSLGPTSTILTKCGSLGRSQHCKLKKKLWGRKNHITVSQGCMENLKGGLGCILCCTASCEMVRTASCFESGVENLARLFMTLCPLEATISLLSIVNTKLDLWFWRLVFPNVNGPFIEGILKSSLWGTAHSQHSLSKGYT